jgi:hypothetical protein
VTAFWYALTFVSGMVFAVVASVTGFGIYWKVRMRRRQRRVSVLEIPMKR